MNFSGEAKVRRYAHEPRGKGKGHRLEGSKVRAERWCPGGFRKGGVPKRFRARHFFPEVNKVYWTVEGGRVAAERGFGVRGSRLRDIRSGGRWSARAQREVRPRASSSPRKLAVEGGRAWGYKRVAETPVAGRRRRCPVEVVRTGWRFRVAKRIV